MGKRAAEACQHLQLSQRPRSKKKKTPDYEAAVAASGLRSSSWTTCLWQQPKTPDDAAPGLGSFSAASHAKRRPRQEEKPNTAPRLPSTATATATAQARLRRRDLCVSWGTKRLRTVRFGNAHGSRWRDWAGLDEGPAGLIADRVLANDVADYVRFRAACLPWRRCCADPRARGVLEDPRLYPRQWIMLRDHTAPGRRFLNTRTGQCVQVDVPELRDDTTLLRATADGLLVLHCRTSKAVRLLNPLTRQTAELPPTTGVVEGTPCCAGLLDHHTVYLYFNAKKMAIARPGDDDRWALLDAGPALIRSTVFFAGRFYGVTSSAILVTVDMAGDGGGPCLVVAAEPPKPFAFGTMTDSVHLVDNGDGDLRLVHRMLRTVRGCDDRYTDRTMYRVYRVNFSTGKTTNRDRRNLGGRAIFVGFYRGLSVSPAVFPFLSTDTIYMSQHFGDRSTDGKQIGAYHARDGSIEPPCNEDRQRHPLSIADSLIAYISYY